MSSFIIVPSIQMGKTEARRIPNCSHLREPFLLMLLSQLEILCPTHAAFPASSPGIWTSTHWSRQMMPQKIRLKACQDRQQKYILSSLFPKL